MAIIAIVGRFVEEGPMTSMQPVTLLERLGWGAYFLFVAIICFYIVYGGVMDEFGPLVAAIPITLVAVAIKPLNHFVERMKATQRHK